MIKTIIVAIITYLATSVDEIPVLYMLYKESGKKGKGKTITISYFIGTFLLVVAGLLAALGLLQIPVKWPIGLIGLIPIIMGIMLFFDGDDDEKKAVAAANKFNALWLKVVIITIALGADDLGVYIPLFTTTGGWEIAQMLFVFFVGTALLCLISYRLTKIDLLSDFIEDKERFIVGIIFVLIGILVLFECGTITALFKLINI